MASLSDRFNQFTGKTRLVVSRFFLHLAGDEVAPLLGVLNQAGRDAINSDGDLQVLGEGLIEICTGLLRYEPYWQSAANEGDVVWDEGEADDYVNQLFMDSGQRYLSGNEFDAPPEDETLSIAPVQNLVVMITIAAEGECPQLETDLTSISAIKAALPTIAGLHSQRRLRAIQVHFSPAAYGDVLTSDQLLENFPELIPL
ncbi:MAG: hypothetical protein RLZZ511_292 [Cyanobacteriota bacterium]